jgi:hypothetical protein
MMRSHSDGCGAAAPAGPGLDDLVADAAGLSLALLGGGVSAARRVIERLAWGRPCRCESTRGCAGECCVVRHHYRYECVPPCLGGPCC